MNQVKDGAGGYLRRAQQLPWRRAYELQPAETLWREAMLQLRTGALDATYFRQKFGVELREHFAPELMQLMQRELLEASGDTIELTRDALLDVDSPCSICRSIVTFTFPHFPTLKAVSERLSEICSRRPQAVAESVGYAVQHRLFVVENLDPGQLDRAPSPQNACLHCRIPGSVSPCHTTTR